MSKNPVIEEKLLGISKTQRERKKIQLPVILVFYTEEKVFQLEGIVVYNLMSF